MTVITLIEKKPLKLGNLIKKFFADLQLLFFPSWLLLLSYWKRFCNFCSILDNYQVIYSFEGDLDSWSLIRTS